MMQSPSLLPGLAFAKIAERDISLGICLLDQSVKRVRPKGCTANHIGKVDQHGKSPVLLQHTVRHGDQCSQVSVIAMRIKQTSWSLSRSSIESYYNLRPNLFYKCLCFTLQSFSLWKMTTGNVTH